MSLKIVIKSLDEVPEALQEHYSKVGDEYVLDADDKDYKLRINDFRDNNISLTKKADLMDDMTSKLAVLQEAMKGYDGIDAEQAREALTKMQAIEDKKLIDSGDLDKLLGQRTDRMRQDYEGKTTALEKLVETLTGDRDTFKNKLTEVTIDSSLQRAVSEVAIPRQGAMRDILSRGKDTWSLNDEGNAVPRGGDGNVIYGTDGKKALSMTEWAQGLLQEVPHLFEANSGGGAGGNTNQNKGTEGVVDSSDQDAINNSIAAIAAGEVTVAQK